MKSCVKIVFVLLLLCSATSCISTRKIIKIQEEKHSDLITSEINGVYKNSSTDFGNDLWKELQLLNEKLFNFNAEPDRDYSDSAIIALTFDEHFVIASIYENDTLQEVIQYKAKVKGNYISIKRDFILFPFPLLYLYHERKTCLSKDLKDNKLILKSGSDEFAYVLIMGNGRSERYMCKFEPVSDL